jgi:hypothetical protein
VRSLTVWASIIGVAVIYNFFTDSRRDNSGEVVAEGRESVFDLRVGDCIKETIGGGEVGTTTVVPCADPHDYEVFANFDLEPVSYLGDDTVAELSGEGCRARFARYFQIAYEESVLEVSAFYPTQDSWTRAADRSVSCLGYRMDGQPMVGKIRGL